MAAAPATILGISALYHDAAAALVVDGEVVAAAQQERFSRRKHDPSFPLDAIRYCLEAGEVPVDGLTAVAYYDKPLTTFVRVLKSYVAAGPRGIRTFPKAMTEWSGRKLWTSLEVERGIRELGWTMPKQLLYAEHHVSHAAAAFYPSPFERAAIVTMDGVGEWATSSIGVGRGRSVELLREQRFPDSLGLLYSAFTHHCGFQVNSGEYKLMGLAPYGRPTYVDRILDDLLELSDDGSVRLDLRYFDYLAGGRMTNRRFDDLFGGPARSPESEITERECDLARSIQEVVERAVLGTARTARPDGRAAARAGRRRRAQLRGQRQAPARGHVRRRVGPARSRRRRQRAGLCPVGAPPGPRAATHAPAARRHARHLPRPRLLGRRRRRRPRRGRSALRAHRRPRRAGRSRGRPAGPGPGGGGVPGAHGVRAPRSGTGRSWPTPGTPRSSGRSTSG
nr:carbamoyltransferase N-terminal domain-containing protein [Aquihabitans sp. G128]